MKLLYTESTDRKNNLDFFRFILAVTVVFSHAYVLYYGTANYTEPLWVFSEKQVGFGTVALNFFFIISGFLVLQSWDQNPDYLTFIKKRVLRIYPGFIVVCLLCAFVFAPLGNGIPIQPFQNIRMYWAHINVRELIHNILLLRYPVLPETLTGAPRPNVINASIWTIPYEFKCYLLIILLAFLNIYKNKFALLIVYIFILIVNILHYKTYELYNISGIVSPHLIPYFPSQKFMTILNLEHFLSFFLSGSFFYFYRNYIPRSILLFLSSLFLLLISARWLGYFELVQPFFGSYILFYIAFSKKIKFYTFAKYGDFSYGFYLYGWPIQQLVLLYIGQQLSMTGNFIVSFSIIFIFSVLSWYLIEKPFLSLKERSISINFSYLKVRI
ncbi:acyltransferase [Spirosoma aureum]|uniref:Acyltransferase n=1 Tax=Spirosoma aureum TaxID=2692134 RepID=A0A6G9AJI9_9BACT|nr:acyltransferase [Spirosoma aureum]QIP12632.1 acyltransferase [Spirosoma aureum]